MTSDEFIAELQKIKDAELSPLEELFAHLWLIDRKYREAVQHDSEGQPR